MRKGNFEKFIDLAKKVHDNKYDYSITKEPNSVKDEIEVLCPLHGVFKTTFDIHVHSKSSCPKCSSKYVDLSSLIQSFKEANSDKKYSYEFVEYANSKTKVKVVCHESDEDGIEHGVFEVRPDHLRNGHGCPKCCNRYLSTNDWVKMARKIHGDEYDYSKVEYFNNKKKVCIICPKHGEFWQAPYSHIAGCGCPKCNGGVLFDQNDFISRACEVHGNKYDYSKFVYVNANTEGVIICPIHGEFSQTPYLHVNRQHGCPMCKSSRLERLVAHHLKKNGIIYVEQKEIGLGKQTIDFYLPFYNIYIECQGEQHYVPTSFSKCDNNANEMFVEIQRKDAQKYEKCKSDGADILYFTLPNSFCTSNIDVRGGFYEGKNVYTDIDSLFNAIGCESKHKKTNLQTSFMEEVMSLDKKITAYNNRFQYGNKLIYLNSMDAENSKKMAERHRSVIRRGYCVLDIFEDEYENRHDIVISKIKHFLQLDDDLLKINGRECVIKEIEMDAAKDFLNANHIQGFVPSSVYIGCFYKDDLVGVMSFLCEGVEQWNLTRYATKIGTLCRGCGGKLFKFFVSEYSPETVKSFADKRWTSFSENNLYTKIGFELAKSCSNKEYRYWKDGFTKERMHKFGFRKTALHNKYGLPLTMSEKEMTKQLGFVRIYDCGLFKYVWKNNNMSK